MHIAVWILIIVAALALHIGISSIAAYVAGQKGHDGLFLCCLFLGLPMLILVAGLPDIRARQNQVEIYKVLRKLAAKEG